MALTLTIKVENAYGDGHVSEQTHAVRLDRFRGEDDLWERLFEFTGDVARRWPGSRVAVLGDGTGLPGVSRAGGVEQ